jgi:hypothetical protein
MTGPHDSDAAPGRMFTFRCGTSGASVTCKRCGKLVARGKYAAKVYPKAEEHKCKEAGDECLGKPTATDAGGSAK